MARIAGVDLPQNKQIRIGLTYIYGIGRSRSHEILEQAEVDESTKVKDLTEEEAQRLRKVIQEQGSVEGDLRKDVTQNIKRLMEIGSYRGVRHRKGLPVRGQRTRTNSRIRKGPRRGTVAGKKKIKK
ncbi:MAG TPA: 30S ribosomal protein S13 [Thermoanaerobaculia bacterium]|nr:30S ribosomal protein S13 [Thermoanaerobaculia bacterium]